MTEAEMARRKRLRFYASIAVPFIAVATVQAAQATGVKLTTVSTMPSTVSGGDVLVEVKGARGARGLGAQGRVKVYLNERDVTSAFRRSRTGRLLGLVEGLREGENALRAVAGGRTVAHLKVVNSPITGPIFSGPHQTPFICETEAFGLGPPLDANCSANTRVEYFYRATDNTFKAFDPAAPRPADLVKTTTSGGQTVDYIVRVETGTINRAIYQIAFLHTPGTPLPDPWKGTPGWNNRLAYTFGGNCLPGYHQGFPFAGVMNLGFSTDLKPLSRGFAVVTSSLNAFGNSCNDVISAETALMVKEHFIERFGIPRYTMGLGGSGGAMAQLMVAQNYPGILDGVLGAFSFPDIFSILPGGTDCSLLKRVFDTSSLGWSDEQKTAVSGFATWGLCVQGSGTLPEQRPGTNSWINVGFSPGWVVPSRAAGGLCNPVIPDGLIYDPLSNPNGARCTLHDNNVNALGIDPRTGFARRPLDNVGVQYGLAAFNEGRISAEQFLDLNERIGGYDVDGNIVSGRSVAGWKSLQKAYAYGRINTGSGGLARIPIIDARSYTEASSDFHDRARSLAIRARLLEGSGHSGNHVILTTASTGALGPDIVTPGSPWNRLVVRAALQLEQWLDNLTSPYSRHKNGKLDVVRGRPRGLSDACYTADGTEIKERATTSESSRCNQLYPVHGDPRVAAGAPVANDVLKCRLKPVQSNDYRYPLSEAQLARLREAFPHGVCDYTLPGFGQREFNATWLAYPVSGKPVQLDGYRSSRH